MSVMCSQFVCKRPWESTTNEADDYALDRGDGNEIVGRTNDTAHGSGDGRRAGVDDDDDIDDELCDCRTATTITDHQDRDHDKDTLTAPTIGLADILWWSTITRPRTGIIIIVIIIIIIIITQI